MQKVLTQSQWQEQSGIHFQRVNAFASAARDRAARREKHPIYDFLTKYYPFSLGKFEKWVPGFGVKLEEAEVTRFPSPPYKHDDSGCSLDSDNLSDKERERHQFAHDLLVVTQSRKPVYSCFGMHEWAMVYTGAQVRHRETAPLRLSQSDIDEVVRARPLVCTHFDAFRFFSPQAQPQNKHQLTLHDRMTHEQPACIHANMDLYKWAFKAMPWIGSELLLQTFFLALELRELDMRASPYDLSDYGYSAIPIETTAGRTEYATRQQQLSEKAVPLRVEVLTALERLLAHCPSECPREQDFS